MDTIQASSPRADERPAGTGDIRVYNTLSRRKEPLQTIEPGLVRMYVCGVTPSTAPTSVTACRS